MLPCGKCAYFEKKSCSCKKNLDCSVAIDSWYLQDFIFLSCACSFFRMQKERVITLDEFIFMLRSKQQLELFSGAPKARRKEGATQSRCGADGAPEGASEVTQISES